MEFILNKKNKKGLSVVIATVILVALTLAAIGIIWTAVNTLVEDSTEGAESCFNLFEKVSIEDRYTCYNVTSGETVFSISVGDVDLEGVLVGVATNTTGVSLALVKGGSLIPGLRMFNGSSTVFSPAKNSGESYVLSGLNGTPRLVEIIPVVGGTECDIIDTVEDFGSC